MKTFFANNIQTYVGVPIPSGSTCILTLSQDAVSLVGNVIAQTRYVIPVDTTGSFSIPIWFTDEINPSAGFGCRPRRFAHVLLRVPSRKQGFRRQIRERSDRLVHPGQGNILLRRAGRLEPNS